MTTYINIDILLALINQKGHTVTMENENKKSKIDIIDEEIIKLLAERVQVLYEEDTQKKTLPI